MYEGRGFGIREVRDNIIHDGRVHDMNISHIRPEYNNCKCIQCQLQLQDCTQRQYQSQNQNQCQSMGFL